MTPNRDGVVVVGSTNLDLIATTPRIPQPGETVLSTSLAYRAGGKGANQAVAAHRAGGRVTFIGAIGDDEFGRTLVQSLTAAGLSAAHLTEMPGIPSGVAMIIVDANAENTITVAPGANSRLTAAGIQGALDASLPTAAVLVLQGEIPLEVAAHAAHEAARAGVRVIFNASPLGLEGDRALRDILAVTDVLIVNESEGRQLGGHADSIELLASALRGIVPGEVVITLGSEGALLAHAGGIDRIPAFRVEAVDSTGAGDAFCGALAATIAAGEATPFAIRVASAAGALATTALGAQDAAPTHDQITRFLRARGVLQHAR
ncbi:MAG: ribokinase [Microbacterium sp.]|nr:ribokinase [Microbacterium sp.]